MRMLKLTDDDQEMCWVSAKPWTESDWPLYFFIRMLYLREWSEEAADSLGEYEVSIKAVSTVAAGPEKCRSAAASTGMTPEDWAKHSEAWQHYELMQYGVAATLWQETGNNKRKLIRAARKELGLCQMLFGFYLDRQQNAIGDTGWDFIKGDLCKKFRQEKEDE